VQNLIPTSVIIIACCHTTMTEVGIKCALVWLQGKWSPFFIAFLFFDSYSNHNFYLYGTLHKQDQRETEYFKFHKVNFRAISALLLTKCSLCIFKALPLVLGVVYKYTKYSTRFVASCYICLSFIFSYHGSALTTSWSACMKPFKPHQGVLKQSTLL